jgi:hypothetical protein
MNNRAAAGAIFDDLNARQASTRLFVDRALQHQAKGAEGTDDGGRKRRASFEYGEGDFDRSPVVPI